MILKVNSSYPTATGFIIPRSRLKGEKSIRYCIVQVLTGGVNHYISKHTTMTTAELRKALQIKDKERIDVQ